MRETVPEICNMKDLLAAGLLIPWGITLRTEVGALAMSGSSILMAVNATLLKTVDLPAFSEKDGLKLESWKTGKTWKGNRSIPLHVFSYP